MLEWGSLVQVVGLLQACIFSVPLLVLPWLFLRRVPTGTRRSGGAVYFLCLGAGFIFLELAFLQKVILFLGTPLYAAAIVIAAFLAGAGLGSWYTGRLIPDLSRHILTQVFGGIAGWVLLWGFLAPLLFPLLLGLPFTARAAVVIVSILPLAFCMGLPFPLGLNRLAGMSPALVPWAWAINGCASVIGALLTPLLALAVGFRDIMILAVACYLVAALVFPKSSVEAVS